MSFSDEESKAIQEVAKTATEYKDSVNSFGEFVGKIVGHPLVQAGGIVGDALGMVRIEMALRFKERVDRIMKERGLESPQRNIPLSVAYPLLEAATLEEDNELSEMFAQLLVNAVDSSYSNYVPKSFVETIKNMSPLEAKILKAMFDAPPEAVNESGMMYTRLLPNGYLKMPEPTDQEMEEVPETIGLALAALRRAGCIEGAMAWGGYTLLRNARVTEYGAALMKACHPPVSQL